MALNIAARQPLHVGRPLVVDADSPGGRYAVVFEDDGEKGCFYAVDTDVEDGNPVQDALLVYVVADVTDADLASTLEIGWSDDGLKALLLINDQPHAAFDFERRQGWCLSGLPEAAVDKAWSKSPRRWSEDVEALFD
ncbi:MAG TPA: DUF2251 domain-containing protein [Burkholderiaceae bacterium]|jgi:hypothetical protein|nr:DUF2251 domain-containing protein [Burkholderiaceae bacterium]